MLKKFLFAVLFLFILGWLYLSFGPKTVNGLVIEPQLQSPVPGINVVVWEQTWAISNKSFVSRKDYFYITKTDSEGKFKITYYRGGAHVHLVVYADQNKDNTEPVKNYYFDFWQRPVIDYP